MDQTPVPTPNHNQADHPTEQNDNPEQALRFEFELLLKEYETATSYALHWLATDGRDMEFTLVAIGAATLASTFAVENKAYFALLMLALPFYVLIWSQIHRGIDSDRRLRYIIEELAKRLNEIIHHPSNINEKFGNRLTFLSYEAKLGEISKRTGLTTFVTALPNVGRGLFKLTSSVFFVFTYFHYIGIDNTYNPIGLLDIFLLVLNALAFVMSCIALYVLSTLHKQNLKFTFGVPDKSANQQDVAKKE